MRDNTTEQQRQLKLRFLIAAITGFVVAILTVCAGWLQSGEAYRFAVAQQQTQSSLMGAASAIRSYQARTHTTPSSLGDLKGYSAHFYTAKEERAPTDGWRRPFIASRHNNHFELYSYGRDGKPGGWGLDCDLSTSSPHPIRAYPTPIQFLFEMKTTPIVLVGGLSGLLAFLLTCLLVESPELTMSGTGDIFVKVVLITLGTVMAAMNLVFLHIYPSH